jgi:hypothetical protein
MFAMDGKVFICKPEVPESDEFLQVKVVNFTEENREALRWHIQSTYFTAYVWFEDEEPPDAFVEAAVKCAEGEPEDDELA